MPQTLAAALSGIVEAADSIFKLWTDRVRGLYVDPPITVASANRIRRRQAESKIAARERAESVLPEAKGALDRLQEQITVALALDVPAPISYAELESRLSEILNVCEVLVNHLADLSLIHI